MATGTSGGPAPLAVGGLRTATVAGGLRYSGRDDLLLVELAPGSRASGVFTHNAFCAAPVLLARRHLESCSGRPRYLLINAGNANAGTGEAGLVDAWACCDAVAEAMGVDAAQVLPFSTGVIGESLPMERMRRAITASCEQLGEADWTAAARAIMTTDTRPKCQSIRVSLGDRTVTLTGLCKGAGMIRPDMATMLAWVFTDAALAAEDLQSLLESAVGQSFNRITVDGDTSTNDCCMLAATGASGVTLAPADEDWRAFSEALHNLMRELAISVIRDAEGASKFVTIDVRQGADAQECLDVAYTIAHSPLVKTALTASDANWGRILAAVGRSGLKDLDVSRVSIHLGDVCIVEGGTRAEAYTEEQGQAVMEQEDITITVDLARGAARERVWTSDLSEEYVRINAEYRS